MTGFDIINILMIVASLNFSFRAAWEPGYTSTASEIIEYHKIAFNIKFWLEVNN